ncbi:three-helix bundle dimerization domain-containing protein [Agromyces bauzanensis]
MSVPESEQLAAAVDRLVERFPSASLEEIRALVEYERSRLEGSRIRDYLPVLIEHSVRDRLREIGHEAIRHDVAHADAGGPPGGNVRVNKVPIETTFNARITLLNGGLGGGTS